MGKFQIPSIPSTTNKTIRFPNDVVEQVENAIQGKDCTFSAFVIAAVRSALESLEETE
ncbi:MAG: YlcI/YnfO family protein [Candidatus Fimenecus sp.]|nr:YlcI/YnfO family protein [Clostridia bacterium]